MDQPAWYKFLQTYCLWTDTSFREVASQLERAVRAPDYLHRPEVPILAALQPPLPWGKTCDLGSVEPLLLTSAACRPCISILSIRRNPQGNSLSCLGKAMLLPPQHADMHDAFKRLLHNGTMHAILRCVGLLIGRPGRGQDKPVADEIDIAMRTPENTKRYVEGRRIQTVFNLWDTDGDGKVAHYKLDRALCRRACPTYHDQCCESYDSAGAQASL
jgi:hypothetical protein